MALFTGSELLGGRPAPIRLSKVIGQRLVTVGSWLRIHDPVLADPGGCVDTVRPEFPGLPHEVSPRSRSQGQTQVRRDGPFNKNYSVTMIL
jgi:hypothetical protein